MKTKDAWCYWLLTFDLISPGVLMAIMEIRNNVPARPIRKRVGMRRRLPARSALVQSLTGPWVPASNWSMKPSSVSSVPLAMPAPPVSSVGMVTMEIPQVSSAPKQTANHVSAVGTLTAMPLGIAIGRPGNVSSVSTTPVDPSKIFSKFPTANLWRNSWVQDPLTELFFQMHRCETCLPGFFGDALKDPKGDCKPCDCNGLGTLPTEGNKLICDQPTGQCNCKNHVTG